MNEQSSNVFVVLWDTWGVGKYLTYPRFSSQPSHIYQATPRFPGEVGRTRARRAAKRGRPPELG